MFRRDTSSGRGSDRGEVPVAPRALGQPTPNKTIISIEMHCVISKESTHFVQKISNTVGIFRLIDLPKRAG